MGLSYGALRRNRAIASVVIALALVALGAVRLKNVSLNLLLRAALLGGLAGLLVTTIKLRQARERGYVPCYRETVLWRVAFLYLFAALNVAVLAYGGLDHWKSNWASAPIAIACLVSAVWLWRASPWAKYPLYALTIYLVLGMGFGVYNYVRTPGVLEEPVMTQIIEWLIPAIPMVLLINCALFARRVPGMRPVTGENGEA